MQGLAKLARQTARHESLCAVANAAVGRETHLRLLVTDTTDGAYALVNFLTPRESSGAVTAPPLDRFPTAEVFRLPA